MVALFLTKFRCICFHAVVSRSNATKTSDKPARKHIVEWPYNGTRSFNFEASEKQNMMDYTLLYNNFSLISEGSTHIRPKALKSLFSTTSLWFDALNSNRDFLKANHK